MFNGAGVSVVTVTTKVRRAVLDRDGEECVVSRSAWVAVWPCGGALTMQHRRGRGMGGAKGLDEVWNLIPMCAVHNQLETSDSAFHAVCVQYGWSVPRWSGIVSSRFMPVWAGGWWLLGDVGRVRLDPVEAEARLREFYGDAVREGLPTHW